MPSWDAYAALGDVWLVASGAASSRGSAALAPVSQRGCYRGVADESVFVATAARGAGRRPRGARGADRALRDGRLQDAHCRRILHGGGLVQPRRLSVTAAGCPPRRRARAGSASSTATWRDVRLPERRSAFAARRRGWRRCRVGRSSPLELPSCNRGVGSLRCATRSSTAGGSSRSPSAAASSTSPDMCRARRSSTSTPISRISRFRTPGAIRCPPPSGSRPP